MGTSIGIIVGILILSVMMFVHEAGHYLTGRLLGFKIIEFSLFMGPVLLSKTSKKTGIKYSLKLFPIGASVRFHGEEGMGEESSDDPDSFNAKPKWKRAVVISTGPIVNIVSGILALIILFSSIGFVTTTVAEVEDGTQAVAAGIQAGDRIVEVNGAKIATSIDYAVEMGFFSNDKTIKIGLEKKDSETVQYVDLVPVKKNVYVLGISMSSAKESGGFRIVGVDPESNKGSPVFKVGDIILGIDGISFSDQYDEAVARINDSAGSSLNAAVLRDGKEVELTTVTTFKEYFTSRGLQFAGRNGFAASISESFKYSISIIRLTFKSISMIFTGELKAKDSLSGPVGVVSIVGSVVNQDAPWTEKVSDLLWMFALISLNLGVFNLLPIPALDGSHLILIGVEAIRRKRLTAKVQGVIVAVGFALIIGLAIIGLVFDIMRITGN
ncbi:MAG: RIP metalloprotease RseP [Saccharofermentanales bacterium]